MQQNLVTQQQVAVSGQVFKEYKWYNTHSLNLELQCSISRLEIPDYRRQDLSLQLSVSAYIVCNQLAMFEPSVSTLFGTPSPALSSTSASSTSSCRINWENTLNFPIKIRDLSLDSLLVITIETSEGVIYGGTSMRLFDDNGSLKQGKQKLLVFFDQPGDSNVIINKNLTPGEYYEIFAPNDYPFIMEKNLEKYRLNINPNDNIKNQWLDRLLLKRIEAANTCEDSIRLLKNSIAYTEEKKDINEKNRENILNFLDSCIINEEVLEDLAKEYYGRNVDELELKKYPFLVIELPSLPYPVLYEERQYHSVDPHHPPSSMLDRLSSIITNPDTINSSLHLISTVNKDNDQKKKKLNFAPIEFSLTSRPFNPSMLNIVADWGMGMSNVYEEQFRKLSLHKSRSSTDINLKPNKEDKALIEQLILRVNPALNNQEMDFLYRFRYSLTDNKKALIKFLYSVNWEEESEVLELPTLLSLWKSKAPLDVADALKLLSKEKYFQHPCVREYAVDILETASDEEILSFLLQLVQALRYEPNNNKEKDNNDVTSTINTSAAASKRDREFSIDLTTSESRDQPREEEEDPTQPYNKVEFEKVLNSESPSPLAKFLVLRACKSRFISNYLYWYLKVEIEDEICGYLYQQIFEFFIMILSTYNNSTRQWFKKLCSLDDYMQKIMVIQREARNQGKKKEGKELLLRQYLLDKNLSSISSIIEWVPLPLDPSIKIVGLNPSTASMFASAVYPCVIEFKELEEKKPLKIVDKAPEEGGTNLNVSIAPPKPVYHKIMFKSGDDLRQDQLIMQLISLMDHLLKKVNLDLKLLTYGILAVSQNDGIMEFVRNSMPISAVEKNFGSVLDYLRHHNPDKNGPYEVSHEAMDTYVKSTAGYSVITYILGVGDRHLDNVMINTSGQLFHIDFGFIFGQDPKPFPPPFRFTRSMADAMGGEESAQFSKFKSYCCQAYNWLRKSANLILNLLSLMGDAGIQDISKRSDLPKVLLKVEEKFRLDLNDEQAEQFFLGLISESLHSLAPKLMEVAHKIAVSMR